MLKLAMQKKAYNESDRKKFESLVSQLNVLEQCENSTYEKVEADIELH
jgi:hypothetical protein